ncbi:TetR/AcrR family transcriptional regulator [Blastococcus sp. TML/M2B]|uniref:TetR/AcrR family transcriptional regulator n=1 Tax=unclassified Blastococcus TaxID=2619396 RepID=UPI00190A085C|nr:MULTISPECIES: TetR/AcrR family transcriptional regulator [unclassified Blastococcus]MBN1091927.1 TetR/AcrR family transcriptional regulator [Blastococcus sp. TML/M2B]MBN1097969.1 TetR/AcrR family transcriptional regulator [Blastococcus sp. TML/C7B]
MSVLSASEQRPSRGGRPRDPSRDGVIRAAILRLLADVGYGALTMDAVAAKAGVGKATIYRRWRTKEELVVDTVSDLNAAQAAETEAKIDTGSLIGDLHVLLRSMAKLVTSPAGAATQAMLSSMQHHPELAEAFRDGPVAIWRQTFDEMWSRAEARGETDPGFAGSLVAEAIGAPVIQRWLVNGEPVNEEFADAVVENIAVPLLRAHGARI